ncbi:MAG: alpha/beta hydrolase, partial [Deltaproteobacteria bacterium]|nr:alpha/beta hydrolase [Deltaproteobacteria bacterium]
MIPSLLPGTRSSMVDAGGLRMHVVEMGPEDGEPVILLHGFP